MTTLSDENLSAPSRFEWLAGRFFDGELSEAEDREFVALLESNPGMGRRFIEMARLDSAIAALISEHRIGDAAFDASVRKSLEFNRVDESHLFAQHLVALVREGSERRRTRRLTLVHERRSSSHFAPYAVAAVACVALAVLAFLFVSRSSAPAASMPRNNTETATAIAASHEIVRPGPIPSVPAPHPEAVRPDELALKPSPVQQRAAPEMFVAENAAEDPEAPLTIPDAPPPDQPASAVAAAPIPDAYDGAATLATLDKLTHASATIQRKGPQLAATSSTRCMEGDVLRIAAIDSSPGEDAPSRGLGPSGAEVTLTDGSRLLLSPGSEIRFHIENQCTCPTLNAGELIAHITPQPPGHPLRIRTQQGPVVEVVGTVFRLDAEKGRKRVSLRVDEGKVLFTSQNVERKVSSGEMCDAEDGHAPGRVIRGRTSPGILTGLVVDKTTGKPIEGATVTAVAHARRKNDRNPTVKSDAQGKFRFDALREGNYFVVAQLDGAGAVPRFAAARARVQPGEETVVSLAADKVAIVLGVVEDSSKHVLVTSYQIRFLAEGSDGLTVDPVLQVEGQTQLQHDAEFHCAVIEGAGKYAPAVEKPGLLIKVRTPQRVQLSADRINQWPLDVQVSPSAAIKGRVLDAATSSALADDPALDPSDPRAPRTVLTLTQSNGYIHALCAESDGSFFFNTNLDAGTYELKAMHSGYAPLTRRITLVAGQSLDADVSLQKNK